MSESSASKKKILLIVIAVAVVAAVGVGLFLGATLNKIGKKPELTWVIKPGSTTAYYNYNYGSLTGCTIYRYFEVTGDSGDVKITVEVDNEGFHQEKTNTFFVEEGKEYVFIVDVCITPRTPPVDPYSGIPIGSEDVYDLTISSPSAASSVKISIKGYILSLALGEMNVSVE